MIPDKLLRMKEVSTLLGVTPQTLRNWSNEGYIQVIIGKGRQCRFKLSEIRRLMNFGAQQSYKNTCLIYCRVSTTIQRANLSRQRDRLEAYAVANGYIIENIYEDIASGMNFKRKGFVTIAQSLPNTCYQSRPYRIQRSTDPIWGGVDPRTAPLVSDRVSHCESGRIGLQARNHR